MCFKDGSADVSLSHLNPKLFKDTPKIWHNYVRMSIARFVDWSQYSYTNIELFKFRIVKWSKVVLEKRYRSIIDFNLDNWHLDAHIKRITSITGFHAYIKRITFTTGQLIIHSHLSYNYYFIYDIDAKLRLNISFFIIYFSVGLQNNHLEALRIYKYIKKHALFTFCGHHSLFNLYPYFKKVFMRFKTWMNLLYVLNFSYSVIDPYIVHNIPKLNFSGILSNLIYKTGHGTLIASFFIQVKKITYIVCHFTQTLVSNYVVYDGPGFSANSIAVSNTEISQIVSSSTFQCIIQLITYSSTLQHVDTFMYTSKVLDKDIDVNLTSQTSMLLQLPNIACFDCLCVVHINTETDHQINVTLHKINSVGVYNPTCKYGGIVAGEYVDNKYKESTTVCQNHEGQIEESRSLYSLNSSLVLVLYWYNKYYNITVSLSLSLMRCKPVNIDVCRYNILCLDYYSTMKRCTKYNNTVTKGSNIKLFPYSNEPFISLKLQDNECFVVQFSSKYMNLPKVEKVTPLGLYNPISKYIPVCYVYFFIEQEYYITQERQREFLIKGKFEKKSTEKKDGIELVGEPDNLQIYLQKNSHNPKIDKSVLNPYIFAQFNTTTYLHEFQILMHITFHSKSWIDIILKQNKPNKTSVSQVGLEKYTRESFHVRQIELNLKEMAAAREEVLLLKFGGKSTDDVILPEVLFNITTFQDVAESFLTTRPAPGYRNKAVRLSMHL